MYSKSFDIVTHPYGILRLEYNEHFVILHLKEMDKMTPSVYRWGLKEVMRISEFLSTLGYKSLQVGFDTDREVLHKIADRLGFVYVNSFENLSIYTKEI